MPINGNDNCITAGKCPFCLQSPPCKCVFNDDDKQGASELINSIPGPCLPQGNVIDVLIDIKNELTDIKNLLQTKSLKEDLEAIMKVHNR